MKKQGEEAGAVLSQAWMIGAICGDIGTADYLVALTQGVVSPALLPVLTFVLAAAVCHFGAVLHDVALT